MSKVQLDSTLLVSADYNNSNNKLVIEFKDGKKYEYSSVPEDVYNGLISTMSAGRYFIRNIKNNYDWVIT